MKNELYTNGLNEQLKKLKQEEKEELNKIRGGTLLQRLKTKARIKMKFYKLRSKLLENNYSKNKIQID